MALKDFCETGLFLGLGCSEGRVVAAAAAASRCRRRELPLEPTLSLSLQPDEITITAVARDQQPPPPPLAAAIWQYSSTTNPTPTSTVSSFSSSVKSEIDVAASEEAAAAAERVSSTAGDEDDGGGAARKKLRLTRVQSALLEERFKEHSTLNPKQKQALAKQLNLRARQVEVWFQNRRARTKLKQTEVDCEILKRCCETLSEENRRLQKELHEVRALQLIASSSPAAATLTICPSCERVAGGAAGNTARSGGDGGGILVREPKPHFYNNRFTMTVRSSAAC